METEMLIPEAKEIPPELSVDTKQSFLQELLDRVLAASKEPRTSELKKEVSKAKKSWSSYKAPSDYSYFKHFYAGEGEKLQNSNMTRQSRFPKIMARLKELNPDAKKIMSFGCSTGNECQDLLTTFPDTELIVGVDIDHHAIQQARRSNKSSKILFTDEINLLGTFDIITMLQVGFCLEYEIPKERWLKVMKKVEPHIAPGGIICVYTSDHPIEEVFTADKYEPVNVWNRKHNRKPNGKDYYNGYYRKKKINEQNTPRP